jgi:DNA repair ATPase RecN
VQENAMDKTPTTKDAGRQWNDDEGVDLRFRLVEELHEIVADEAEALAGYADILEADNPYLEDADKRLIKAIMQNERDHEDKINAIIRRLDGLVANSNVDELAKTEKTETTSKSDPFMEGLGN